MNLTPTTAVGDIAAGHPKSLKVFHRHGIDFCCGGRRPLSEVCAKSGLDPQTVLDQIAALECVPDEGPNWEQEPLPALIDHLIERYHRPMDEELPRIEAMARRVNTVHGSKDPTRFSGILTTFLALRDELVPHMVKEETILFPWIRTGRGAEAATPVRVMLIEHESVGGMLHKLRELTEDYQPAPEACGTWRALFQALGDLELDLMEHIHLENNILFPRALQAVAA